MKLRYIFLFIWSMFLLDFFSTYIGLNYFGLTETTPLKIWLFSFGQIGYVYDLILTSFILFLVSLFIFGVQKFALRETKNEGISSFAGYFLSVFMSVNFLLAFVNNVYWMIRVR